MIKKQAAISLRFFLLGLMATAVLSTWAYAGDHSRSGSMNAQPRARYRQGEIAVKLRTPLRARKNSAPMIRTGLASLDDILSRYEVSGIAPRFKHRPASGDVRLPLSQLCRITFPAEHDPLQVANALSQNPHVEYAEPIYINAIEKIPDDPDFPRQSHLLQVLAAEAWDKQLGDSTIVIAIIDNGTQLDHPDLSANLWTNEIEAAGLRGLDDDGNGYIDDIHGYDMAEEDGDPSNCPKESGYSYYSHGTHTAGLAAAATNNDLGVSGISWNCEFMPVKASFDDTPQFVDKGYDGIIYAAENGADIINCSWGSFKSYSRADQEAINYAYALGSIIVAAAGNDNKDDLHYPSSYMNTLSVAWVDGQDKKAYNGTWGIGVDVSAPGSGLWSTVPTDNGSYGSSSGSSMAAPLAAGLCALVKAGHPDWSNDSIVRQVALTTDNIDAQNPSYAGLLGSGRINSWRAVTETELSEVKPRLEFFSLTPNDSVGGDGDGFFERGEQVTLYITLRNYSLSPAQGVAITLSTDDPDLAVDDAFSSLLFFPPDTMLTASNPMTFSISPEAEAHMAIFFIEFTCAEGASGNDTVSVIVGRMPVLLVDDDDGENNVEPYYTMLLDSLGIQYAHWEHLSLGSPALSLLRAFPIVVWLCEWNFPALDEADQAALGAYLDYGGNLFLSGQDIGWDFYDPEGYAYGSSDWYEKYLHAVYIADDSPVQSVVGTAEDIIAHDLSFNLWQPGRTSADQYPDEIEPTSDGHAIFTYEGGQHHYAGVRFEGSYKVLYLGFGLEAINGQYNVNPLRNWETRMEVLRRTLDWMSFIQHTPSQDYSDENAPIPIWAKLAGAEQGVQSVQLVWKYAGENEYTQTEMGRTDDSTFAATIPAPHETTTVYYYILAQTDYFEWTAPAGAGTTSGGVYSVRVTHDQTPPLITQIELLADTYKRNGSASVKTKVTDSSGVRHVTLYAQTQQGPVDSIPMVSTGQADIYEASLHWSAQVGDEIGYMIEAIDSSALANASMSDMYSFQIVNRWMVDDFESGSLHWDTGHTWQVAPSGHNSPMSITDSPDGPYGDGAENVLLLLEPLDLSACSTAVLTFWHAYDTETDHDFGHVEVRADSLAWHVLAIYSGYQPQWVADTVSLADFCGEGHDHIWLRFRLSSDSSNTADGWYLDDVTLWVDSYPTGVRDTDKPDIPSDFILGQNYPNPFNPATSISYTLPVQSTKSEVEGGEGTLDFEPYTVYVNLRIYNVLGQHVRTLMDEDQTAGLHTVNWDGLDESGRIAASGIYLYRLVVNGGAISETKRMLLLR